MIIAPFPKKSLFSYFPHILKGLWLLVLVASLFWVGEIFYRPFGQLQTHARPLQVTKQKREIPHYEKIGTGVLALLGDGAVHYLHYLSDELLFMASNTRPDARKGRESLLFGLKGGASRVMKAGGRLYLVEPEGEDFFQNKIAFSPEKTELWVTAKVVDEKTVLANLRWERKGKVYQFLLKQNEILEESGKKCFKALQSGKLWGKDALIQNYGGDHYAEWKKRVKVEFGGGQICFLAEGDLLYWDGHTWQIALLKQIPPGTPLAKVQSVGTMGIEIEAWDETGFSHIISRMDSQKTPRINENLSQILKSIRLRTSTQITCVLGKRRMILKQGDWLLKSGSGWKNLRKSEDIDACLVHKLKGELFIFDDLEKKGGQLFLKGHVFDEMRTQMVAVNVPISASSQKTPKRKEHRK